MPVNVRRVIKPLLVGVAAYGLAGCVTQLPWELPDPYSSPSSSPYYYGDGYYGSGGYGYGSRYYGYYGDPYYYGRGGVRLPYPGYGYAPYPGYTCWDTNRDGRCDRRRDDDGDHGGGDDDAGNGGGRTDSDHPLRDVRRAIREREQERGARNPGAAPNAATLRSVVPATGEAPKVRVPARVQTQTPASTPPRVETRRPSETSSPLRRGPRAEDAPRGPRDDSTSSRRPLR